MRRKHISLLLVTAVTFLRTNAAPFASQFDENEVVSSTFQEPTSSILDSVNLQIEPSSSFLDMQSSVLFSNRFVIDEVDGSHLSSLLNEVYLEPTRSSYFQEGSSSYPARPNDILQPLVVQLAESMLSDLNYRIESSVFLEASSSMDAVSSLEKPPSSVIVANTLVSNDDEELNHFVNSKAALLSKFSDVQQGIYTSSPTFLDNSVSSSYLFQKSSSPHLHSIRYSAEASKTPDLPEESNLSLQTIASALLLNDVVSHDPIRHQDNPSSTKINHVLKSSSASQNLLSSSVETVQKLSSASETPELSELYNLPFEVVASALLMKGTDIDKNNDLYNTELHHSSKLSSSVPGLHSSFFKTLLKSTPSSRTPELPEVSNLPFQEIASALLSKGTSADQNDEFTSTKLHPSLTRTFRPSALRITPSPKPILVSSSSLSMKASDAAIASSFFDAILSSLSSPNVIAESLSSPLFNGLNEPISSMVTQLQPKVSSGVHLPQMQSVLYNADLLRSSIIKNTPVFSSLIQPTPTQLSTAASPLTTEADQFTNLIEINNLSTVQPNNSAATVDKIIEGLMNIIRPLNSQNLFQNTLLPSVLTIPETGPLSEDTDNDVTEFESSSQLLQSLHKFYLTPSVDHRTSSKSTIQPQILPSSTIFISHPSSDVPFSLSSIIPPLAMSNTNPSSEQFDISVIQAILHQEEERTTTQGADNDIGTQGQRPEFSQFDKPEVATFNARPSTVLPLSTPSFSQPKPAIVTPIFNNRRPSKRPSSTRSSTRTTPRRTISTSTSSTTSTTKRPAILAFGEAKPIVLDLFDNDSSEAINSRLPSTGSSPLAEGPQSGHIEATIGSNILKIKEKIPTLRPPTRKPSLQFVSSQFHFDDLVSSSSEPPSSADGRPTVRPFHSGSAPAIIPLKVTTPSFDADQPVEMDHANNQHNVISSQATFFIRPTSASSSIVRQTIFQTVVSISDSTDEFAHFHDEEPEDFPAQNALATSPSTPSVGLVEHNHEDFSGASGSLVNEPSVATTTARPTTTTTTTSKPTTTTARPSTTPRATTTTTSSTTTSKKPRSTRRPALRPLRSSTRRPFRRTTKKPIADAPTITVTKRPSRPGQTLLNFGYTLIPAAVIATIIGLPLVMAGKKKRDVGSEDDFLEKLRRINEFIEKVSQQGNTLKGKAFRRRSLRNMKSKWR